MCLASGSQWFRLTHLGNDFGVNPFYNGVYNYLYSLRMKGLGLFRLANSVLVDPPNIDNVRVCSEHYSRMMVSLLIC